MFKRKRNRVAVIGSSHVGALKLACDSDKSIVKNTDLTFFAARSSMYRDAIDTPILTTKGASLFPATESLAEAYEFTSGVVAGEVAMNRYDEVIIYGFAPRIEPTFMQQYSEQVVIEYLRSRRLDSPLFKLIASIQGTSPRGKLYVAPPPMNALVRETNKKLLKEYSEYVSIYSSYLKELGVTLLTQPESTLTESAMTKSEYAKGSMRLDVGLGDTRHHREGDRSHMNADYGALCLKKWLQR